MVIDVLLWQDFWDEASEMEDPVPRQPHKGGSSARYEYTAFKYL
jgi:hypothetical protein